MATRARSQHGASARAGKASSSAGSKKKTAARRAPARSSRTPLSAATARKTTQRKATPKKAAAKKTAPVVRLAPRGSLGFPILPVSIVVALVMLGWFMYPILRMQYAEQRKLQVLETQLAQVQKRNEKLKTEVERLKTPEGIEAAAHELGLARKGEQVWVTVVSTAPAEIGTGTPAALRTADVTPGIWTRVLDTVFGVGE